MHVHAVAGQSFNLARLAALERRAAVVRPATDGGALARTHALPPFPSRGPCPSILRTATSLLYHSYHFVPFACVATSAGRANASLLFLSWERKEKAKAVASLRASTPSPCPCPVPVCPSPLPRHPGFPRAYCSTGEICCRSLFPGSPFPRVRAQHPGGEWMLRCLSSCHTQLAHRRKTGATAAVRGTGRTNRACSRPAMRRVVAAPSKYRTYRTRCDADLDVEALQLSCNRLKLKWVGGRQGLHRF